MKTDRPQGSYPAAGFGTRFLLQTKAMPKEMLPIVTSLIQHVVEAGCPVLPILDCHRLEQARD
jgi:hypothetical protein